MLPEKRQNESYFSDNIVHYNISVSIHVFGHELILWPCIKTLD